MSQKLLFVATLLMIIKMAASDGGGITVIQSVGRENTILQDPVIGDRTLSGLYIGKIDLVVNEGPKYIVEVYSYTEFNSTERQEEHKLEGRQVEVRLVGNGAKAAFKVECEDCGKIKIYNKNKLVVYEANNAFGILAKKGKNVVAMVGGQCFERVHEFNKGKSIELGEEKCYSAIREMENPEEYSLLWMLISKVKTFFGKQK